MLDKQTQDISISEDIPSLVVLGHPESPQAEAIYRHPLEGPGRCLVFCPRSMAAMDWDGWAHLESLGTIWTCTGSASGSALTQSKETVQTRWCPTSWSRFE